MVARLKQTTTAPVAPSEPAPNLEPEFARVPDIQRLFGIRRGICYRLIGTGDIKSVVIRKTGSQTGVRLVHLQSVRDFLNRNLAK